jgi:hypothetical protein
MARSPPLRAQTAAAGPDRRNVVIGLAGALLAGVAVGAAVGGKVPGAAAQAVDVDLALVLAVDCSWSVDAYEFRLQMQGLAAAFRRPEIQRAIASGEAGRIVVANVQWSHERNQVLSIPWTLIAGGVDADALAAVLDATPRHVVDGATAIGAAMEYCAGLLRASPVAARRKVIDISCDGRSNRGVHPSVARDRITAGGMTINGLVILDEWPTLDLYFQRQVVGGPDHFVIVADDYEAYAQAIYRKLLQEITGPGVA